MKGKTLGFISVFSILLLASIYVHAEEFSKPALTFTLTVNNPGSTTKTMTRIGVKSRLIYGDFQCLSGAEGLSILADYPIYFHVETPETIQSADPPLDIPAGKSGRFTISLHPNATGACGGWSTRVRAVAIFSDGTKLETAEEEINASDVVRVSKSIPGKDKILAGLKHRDVGIRYNSLEALPRLKLDVLTVTEILKSKINDSSARIRELAYSQIMESKITSLIPDVEKRWIVLESKLTENNDEVSSELLTASRSLSGLGASRLSGKMVNLLVNQKFTFAVSLVEPLINLKSEKVPLEALSLLEQKKEWAKWFSRDSQVTKVQEEFHSRYWDLLRLVVGYGDTKLIPRIKKLLDSDKFVTREFLWALQAYRTKYNELVKDSFVINFKPYANRAWEGSDLRAREAGLLLLARMSESNEAAVGLLKQALADKEFDIISTAALEIRNAKYVELSEEILKAWNKTKDKDDKRFLCDMLRDLGKSCISSK